MTIVELVKKVIMSWQVIVITVAIIVYFSIVSYAARSYHHPRSSKRPKVKLFKKKKAGTALDSNSSGDVSSGLGSTDELGIEEA